MKFIGIGILGLLLLTGCSVDQPTPPSVPIVDLNRTVVAKTKRTTPSKKYYKKKKSKKKSVSSKKKVVHRNKNKRKVKVPPLPTPEVAIDMDSIIDQATSEIS
ncbi:MAG: hypothetical protein JJV88_01595 [Sulfurovum sp.]|nr:hypothetical protein [Sulfurovaceae bacterium]